MLRKKGRENIKRRGFPTNCFRTVDLVREAIFTRREITVIPGITRE